MGKCCFLGNSIITEGLLSILLIKKGLGLVEMTWGLVHAIYSLPEWQAVKLTFFARKNVEVLDLLYAPT